MNSATGTQHHGPHEGHGAHDDDRADPDRTRDDGGQSHDRHAGHSPEMFRDRLWVSIALTVPILYFSEQIQSWFGYEAIDLAGSKWVNPVLATILYLYSGSVFLKGAYSEVKLRRPGMMTLIAIAISVAYSYSLAVSLGLDGEPFYWELATLLVVMLLGHWMEMRSIAAASNALQNLAAMIPPTAHLITVDGLVETDLSSVNDGDRLVVLPGEQIPTDGRIEEGATSVNEAFLTGESRPVPKRIGDELIAGAINGDGSVTVLVTRTGDSTTLSQIMRLVEEAQASRSQYEVLADRAARWLTIVAVGTAIPTFLLWWLVGDSGTTFAVARAVTVLVIACPHALGLAIPLVNMNATGISARNGILVRNREAFERGRNVRYVAFDKTGTLTEGRFGVTAVTAGDGDRDQALGLAAALEARSEHPLASAIVAAAEEAGTAIAPAESVSAVPGYGVEGRIGNRYLRLGRPEWAKEGGVTMDEGMTSALAEADRKGESSVVLIEGNEVLAVISLSDRIRETASATITRLRDLGVEPVMVSGDAEAVVATVAESLGLKRFYSRVLPGDKTKIVEELRGHGPTAFVGDGINDAPALLAADLGLAIGAGTNVAIESADLVLVEDDPSAVAKAITLSNATHRKMIQNLGWATGYNVVAIPLAAGVGAAAGILLSPAIGAIFMSLSTVIVAINAMLLRRVDLDQS